MNKWIIIVLALSLFSFSCKKTATDELTSSTLDSEEMAQQIGETMASIDESGGSSGQYAFMKADLRTFARRAPEALEKQNLMSLIVSKAEAATCSSAPGFGSCTNDVIVRNFNNCTIGSATVSGTVTLSFFDADGFNDTTCSMAVDGQSITRNPNYTVTGLRNAQLAVTKTGTFGQQILRSDATTFFILNDGINRKLTFAGQTLIDVTTTISNAQRLTVTGNTRNGRVLNGGTIVLTDNLSGKICSMSPSNVTWNNTCNCAISGSWSGSCDTGTTADITITGCGTANIDINGESKSITFDRCY
ncbi:hypothetical protein [Pseudobdellovibrio sp. HCB154]|uniref:hypothetical protein n=1 Tax=Pseudobdellovibrio sp. HCB154 TaxID=3386277 RepID=UPI003916FD5E